MQKELTKLLDVLQRMDDDPKTCMMFYTELQNKNAKFEIIQQTIMQIISDMHHYDPVECKTKSNAIIDRMNYRYFHNQHIYCWQSHISHFHMSFQNWINCPHTCITEIKEFVEKLLKGD